MQGHPGRYGRPADRHLEVHRHRVPGERDLCDLETIYVLRQDGGSVEGRSDEAYARCTDLPSGRIWAIRKEAGVVWGNVENGRIDLSDTGNWHCLAELHPTRLEGHLEIYYSTSADTSIQVLKSGTCVLEKISDVGYGGPRP
jgi:hypothetical protein